MVLKAVLMRSSLVSFTTARPVNIAQPKSIVNSTRPMTNVFNKADSTVRRPSNNKTTTKNSNFNQRVNTVSGKNVSTTRPKAVVNTAKPKAVLNVVKGNQGTCPILLTLKKLIKDMLPLEVTPKEGKSQAEDGTSSILKSFITGIENLVDHKVKVIICDNGTEFKNKEMNQFCEMKGILRQVSVARTPQQNGVVERRNRTLIEAARTMLANSKLPTTFWAEVVNTACYVQNRVLVVKPHNKTPYELFHGKFDGKADEGFFVGYSLNSKAFRVVNSRTRIVKENLHIRFSESTPNVAESGPDWLFDINALTRTMNNKPIVVGTESNGFAGTKASDNVGQAKKETEPVKDYILLPLWTADPPFSQDPKSSHDDGSKPLSDDGISTNEVNAVGGKTSIELPDDPNMPALEDYSIFDFTRNDKDDGVVADMNNLDTTIQVSPILTTRIHKDHPLD
ncbi:ribonuclease H-like domain-containing protein [Tanacetum coccineum]|uniref:Ribonuclease H-like domain-containing protein n=1 Tax=Tanacetum coccineum TaxID=301880 RepID=A0ABQ5ESD8_9ASTR